MKSKKIILMLSLLFILMMYISSVSAANDNEDYNLTTVSSVNLESHNGVNSNEIELSTSNEGSVLSESKTIYVTEVGEYHNEMNEPTIQKAIDGANDGDTIIIEGKSYVHCHFIVNKKLTIKSNIGTVMTPCGSIATSNYQGIFYLSSKASGSVIEGFNINAGTNVFNTDAYGIYAKEHLILLLIIVISLLVTLQMTYDF